MEISDVKAHIKSGKLDKFYIFYGEEHQVMKLYIQQMSQKCKLPISYVDSIYDLVLQAKVTSLLKEPHLYIVMDDKAFLSDEKLWQKFTGLKDDIVIFYYTKADQRLKFWKNFKDRAVEFRPLADDVLVKYIRKIVYNLSEESCLKLIEACENDYGRIMLELDKVIAYWEKTNGKKDENAIVDMFLKDGTIYQPPYDAIFDFTDAVLAREPGRVFDLLSQSYAVGEANMVLLSVLYNNFRTLLMVQSSKDWRSLGLNGFAVKNVIKHSHIYTNGEIIKAMQTIRQAEKGIKTGEMPDEISMYYVLSHIL